MFKRLLWLALAIAAGWLIWRSLRQRQDDVITTMPQFAPPRTFAPPRPPAQIARQPEPEQAAASDQARAPLAKQQPQPSSEPSLAKAPPASDEPATEISGYCMRCKTKRPIQDVHHETTESGRPAARGTCPVCGANMFTFLKDNGD